MMEPTQDHAAVLTAALEAAPFDGWSDGAFTAAAAEAGFGAAEARLLFPDGVRDLLRFWAQTCDEAMAAAFEAQAAADMRVRDKATLAVRLRLEALADHKEAARRAAAFLALPQNAALGAAITAETSDAIWRVLGDRSTDFNFYTKRAILSGVYVSTLTIWFGDDSAENARTWAFLDDRIGNVMQFEKAKALVNKVKEKLPDPVRALARMRYGFGR